jgi:hypothetical protein
MSAVKHRQQVLKPCEGAPKLLNRGSLRRIGYGGNFLTCSTCLVPVGEGSGRQDRERWRWWEGQVPCAKGVTTNWTRAMLWRNKAIDRRDGYGKGGQG